MNQFNKSIVEFIAVLFICCSLVGCGGSSSSSGGGAESTVQLSSQHATARVVLTNINPRSIETGKEFGGYIYRNPDGSFDSTVPVVGTRSNILLPERSDSVPSGSIATAWYHTHGNLPSAENFSAQDNEYSSGLKLDAYLATPSGQFRYRQFSSGQFFDFGSL